jgi:hypothetical protein
VREGDLVEALIELEAARGTRREADARAAADGVLAVGRRVPCDDGVLRERPATVAVARRYLEWALERV